MPTVRDRVVTRGRGVRGKRVHLPGVPVADERNTISGLVQPEHEQMAVDELRLFVPLGEGPVEIDVRFGGRPAVLAARLRRRRRLQTLGHTVEQTFQVRARQSEGSLGSACLARAACKRFSAYVR